MKAKVGDFLVVNGTTTERHDQHAEIIEVRSQDGSPPYVVRWLVTDHEATVYPGSDAVVVTAARQEAARDPLPRHLPVDDLEEHARPVRPGADLDRRLESREILELVHEFHANRRCWRAHSCPPVVADTVVLERIPPRSGFIGSILA